MANCKVNSSEELLCNNSNYLLLSYLKGNGPQSKGTCPRYTAQNVAPIPFDIRDFKSSILETP